MVWTSPITFVASANREQLCCGATVDFPVYPTLTEADQAKIVRVLHEALA
jgi:hypothetical protein